MSQMSLDWDQPKPAIISEEKTRKVTNEAVKRATYLVGDERKAEMYDAILQAAKSLPLLTSDDIWVILGEPRDKFDGSALGPVMRQAAGCGVIRSAERRQRSKRPITHGKWLPVWESLIYRG